MVKEMRTYSAKPSEIEKKWWIVDAEGMILGRLASAFTIILGLFVAAVVIFPTFNPGDLIAGLGITSVAIGFAFKDVLQNFFAGILILWRRPFIVGDEIKVGNYEGTVEEITTRSTRVKTYDGERAVLPNGDVYTNNGAHKHYSLLDDKFHSIFIWTSRKIPILMSTKSWMCSWRSNL